jgi:site-specific recombinase XerD
MSTRSERLLRLYKDHIRLRFEPKSVEDYFTHLRAFLGWLHEKGIELGEVRTEDIQLHQNDVLAQKKKDGKPYSMGHHENRLIAIKSLFRLLYQRGYILHDPASTLSFQRRENRIPRVILSPAEAKKLIEAAKEETPCGLRDRAILETLYATGIRVSELSKLTPFDIDLEEKTLRVLLGKGRKDRKVPLTDSAAEAIELYLESGRPRLLTRAEASYLFLADKGGRLHRAVLSRIVQTYTRKAKVKKHVTCHVFRHSVATHLLRGGADIRHIQKLLGHGSLLSTQRYTRVEISDLKKAIARAHPRS